MAWNINSLIGPVLMYDITFGPSFEKKDNRTMYCTVLSHKHKPQRKLPRSPSPSPFQIKSPINKPVKKPASQPPTVHWVFVYAS